MNRFQPFLLSRLYYTAVRRPGVLQQATRHCIIARELESRNVQTSCCRLCPLKFESPFYDASWKGSLKRRMKMLVVPKHTLYESSVYLYEACTDHVPVELFFKEFEIPDTYYGWFLVTELHVWLMMSRVNSEGPEGRFLRNQIVERFWDDSTQRLKKLAKMGSKDRKETLYDLLEHFQACILSYDEGLLGSDKVLAGALWRILFTYNCQDIRYLETIVKYIRVQNEYLQSLSTEDMVLKSIEFKWTPFSAFHQKS